MQLLKPHQLTYEDVRRMDENPVDLPDDVSRQVEIQCKYEGYLDRQEAEVKKFRNLERMKLPPDIDYCLITGLSTEIRQKLLDIQPLSLGQASRQSGVPSESVSVSGTPHPQTPGSPP